MSKINSLVPLVNSLSKGEKRYFKLYSGLQEGSKSYMQLFDCLDKGMSIKEAKDVVLKKKESASFNVICNYLYKLIISCVLHVRAGKTVSIKLMTDLLKAGLLFDKGLHDDGFLQLENIQSTAERFELPMIRLLALKMQLDYISNLNFHKITEKELIEKQMKVQELIRYSQHYSQHASLYQLLHHRLLHNGSVRTEQQKAELNDLLIAEVNLVSRPFAETFESRKNHLLFQAYYFISVSNYKPALKAFYELNQLFEEQRELWEQSPMDYILTIEGILDSLHTIRQHKEIDYYIQQLKRITATSGYPEITIQRIIFTYTIIVCLNKGDFRKAVLCQEDFRELLFKRIKLLDPGKQAEVHLYTALIFMGTGDMKKAHAHLNKILFESKLYSTLPVYRTFRLIHLLVHFELGNHDYIRHEIRSMKRDLTGNHQQAYELEKIIFRFVGLEKLPASIKERTALWEKTQKELRKAMANKYEIQLWKIFDFSGWIESRLLKKSFAALLKERFQEEKNF
ncbi:MAG: hypothetical protein H7Y03_02000 [Chitinophagaceae bacterium]|nr:hypothetical protein [Chitinophagaceae bacterium]